MASNYVISLYLYSLEGNKRLQQIGRKKGVVLPKRHNALITGTIEYRKKFDSIGSLSWDHVLYQAAPSIFLRLSLVQLRGFTS